MPSREWKVEVRNHPGSTSDDIAKEPDWGDTNHEHFTGYKNSQGRRPGVTHQGDEHEYVDAVKAAWEDFQQTKQAVKDGHLVDFRNAITHEKDFHLLHPQNRSMGWRYVLDYTEGEIKDAQDWPANVKKREAQRQEEQKRENDQQSDEPQDGPGNDKEAGHQDAGLSKGSSDNNSDRQDSTQKGKTQGQKQNASQGQEDHEQLSGQDNQQRDRAQDQRGENEGVEKDQSPQELALLRAVKQEQEYLRNILPNDGTGHSNVTNRTTISIDEADQFTPDNWIPRSSELIRLAGKHPLNAEAPLYRLYESGFITPNELHYVRSHGAVPRLLWEVHQLNVTHGDKRAMFSMDDIKTSFRVLNIPVFMACDNGRRKEMNLIKRTKGFNWGPGAVGCAYWKGPLLRDVLIAAGVPERMPDQDKQRYFIHFRGADNPSEVHYETSISLDYAMDITNDVLLAYEMNDMPLPPDHGYPLRVIIPGYVGGRQVKWLRDIWINTKENDSHYHIWDNRVVPSFVTSTDSEVAKFFFHHPDTAAYEQHLNSLIATPAQGDRIELRDVVKGKEYRIKGFAYNGRGDEVQRVEVSLDEGQTWLYCIRTFPEAPVRHGRKFWTWCFWYVDVDVGDLIKASGITVRCFDVKKMTQPERPIWNILGTMNNCMYTVRPELINDDSPHILFRHPVEPGNGEGGWMKNSIENQLKDAETKTDAPAKQFTRAEIEKHDNNRDCWLVVDNRVYDATSVLAWHPGGAAAIMPHAGAVHQQTTDEFSSIHDDYAYQRLNECILGVVTEKAKKYIAQTAEQAKKDSGTKVPPDQALQRHRWVPAKLIDRKRISRDSNALKFRLPANTEHLGIGTCQHVEFGFHMQDRMLIRPYTPTKPVLPRGSNVKTDDPELYDGTGTFELTVKTYFPDGEQPGGAFSNILDVMPIGEEVEIRGPTGDIIYEGQGKFKVYGEEKHFKRVSLVLGGTGLTPGYSMIARACLDPDDETELRVIDANKTEDDILLRKELEHFQEKSGGRLKVTHVLSSPSDQWKGLKGLVNKEIIQEHLFNPSKDSLALLCGPPTMIQKAVLPVLEQWGYQHDSNMLGL